jgi:hypothetical protein
MADAHPALCKTTTATTGTSDYVLNTASLSSPHRTPKQAVADGSLSDGDIVTYVVWDTTVTGDASFEKGSGVYTDATNTIARNASDVEDGSSGPGVLISWPASGLRDVTLQAVPAPDVARTDRTNTFGADQIIDSGTATTSLRLIRGSQEWRINVPLGDTDRFVIRDHTNSTAPVRIDVNSPTSLLRLTDDGRIGINVEPQTDLHIQESTTDTVPAVEVEQLSTGDAGLQFSIVGDAYAMGIDNSDSDYFKISYASSAGGAVLGTNDAVVVDGVNSTVAIGGISPTANTALRIKSQSATTPALLIEDAGSTSTIFEMVELVTGNQISLGDGSVFWNATVGTDPRNTYDTGTTIWQIGVDASTGEFSIEAPLLPGAFANPALTVTTSRTSIKQGLLNLTQTSTAADPTTTEYPNDGDVGVHHNTTSGNRFWVWNDGGTIYKVQMT